MFGLYFHLHVVVLGTSGDLRYQETTLITGITIIHREYCATNTDFSQWT